MEGLSKYAERAFAEHFANAFYIGRYKIDKEAKHHKFFYIGYRDLFGVAIPHPNGKYEFQLWGMRWTLGRDKKLDQAVANALKGKFPECRHNVQLKMRANSHGAKFIKPEWRHAPKKAPATKEKVKLPIRGRRRKRIRRELKV